MTEKTKMKSKWFVVATEGATTDGRKIEREWLTQIAENYDPKKYGARINLEHFRWRYFMPNDPHSFSYGDVLAVKTAENEEGKLQLYAQIEPTESLIQLVKDKQKVYTSVEIDLNFADSNQAYLVGLAVTDTPASLGTEYLNFCASAQHSPLAERKQKAENLIGEAQIAELEFSEESQAESWLTRFNGIFSKGNAKEKSESAQQLAEFQKAVEMLADKFSDLADENRRLQEELQTISKKLTASEQQAADFAQNLAELNEQKQEGYTERPQATGATAPDTRFF